ncbi:beta-lactamase-like protein [Fennellomyces sp. T-0311]|nr:beta-lactamase-like protein [Fennellomyces sp. T-0311]
MVAPIDITFLGTGSAQPSSTRNHQSMAFRADGEIWLFDAGEATQHQLQKSNLKMGRITKVFITHMHGDHCFGLPPLLCTMTENLNPNRTHEGVVDVYGPRPLRQWLRVALQSTYSRLGRHYRVHEMLLEGESGDSIDSEYHPDEERGTNIYIKDGAFDLPVENGWSVRAAPIKHSIPSYGYVLQEPLQPGKVDQSVMIPKIQRNADALRQQGYKNPMALLGELQRTQKEVILPDGDVLSPPERRPGRQVVILGDTYDASAILPLCSSPHLLVHEATNALTRLDHGAKQEITLKDVEERAISHGHSTPQMAAELARRMSAQKLILTHFSARYVDDDKDEESVAVMEEIRQQAIGVFGDNRDKDVFCAGDLWSYEIKY